MAKMYIANSPLMNQQLIFLLFRYGYCISIKGYVHPLTGWSIGCWLVGPLLRPLYQGYRRYAANLGWFNRQLPSQSLCLNATLDSNGDSSKGWSKQVVLDRYDTSKVALVVEKNCKSLDFSPFFGFFAILQICNFAI